jgi:16S rRNA G966 N2-methylase RsmD
MSIILRKFNLNTEGKYSITKPYESEQITKHMIKFINNEIRFENCVITDATACMGGDLINFSKKAKYVNGVENNKENFDLLVENCKTFECNNINLINEDYLNIYNKLTQDIIYIDPRWGGPDYKLMKNIHLYVGNVLLCDIINTIRAEGIAKYIFTKIPRNACLDNIAFDESHVIYNRSKTISFVLLCIKI